MTRPTAPCPFYGMPCQYVPMAHDAEALRAEVERLTEALGDNALYVKTWSDDYDTLRAENARLREALEKINVGEGWAALIARAALTQPEKEIEA